MRPLSALCLPLVALLAARPLPLPAAELVPVSPAMAERLMGSGSEVTAEFQQLVTRSGTDDAENLAELADTGSADWRLYYRDRQMLFAVPTRRNLTAGEKNRGEQQAAKLAIVLLQQRFNRQLGLDGNTGLAPDSVRVVFIEPAVHEIAAGGWGGSRSGCGGCGRGPGGVQGLASPPQPFAPAGFWPVTGAGHAGGCGCR